MADAPGQKKVAPEEAMHDETRSLSAARLCSGVFLASWPLFCPTETKTAPPS